MRQDSGKVRSWGVRGTIIAKKNGPAIIARDSRLCQTAADLREGDTMGDNPTAILVGYPPAGEAIRVGLPVAAAGGLCARCPATCPMFDF